MDGAGELAAAQTVTVYVSSNRFREELPQYACSATHTFEMPTADTLEIVEAATALLKQIYRQGILYKKSGVIMGGIVPTEALQMNLFDTIRNRKERTLLMQTIDRLNHRYGTKTVRLLAEGDGKEPWRVRCEYRSPNYLTDIGEILTIRG